MATDTPSAFFGGMHATELVQVSSDPQVLDQGGRWAVLVTYEGEQVFARFEKWSTTVPAQPGSGQSWAGPDPKRYSTSITRDEYLTSVGLVQEEIAKGEVYQVNLCRILSTPLGSASTSDISCLWTILDKLNPSPFSGYFKLPSHGVELATASPELSIRRRGLRIESGPIKGTTTTGTPFLDKDRAENIMIVDLVRNDLGRICVAGSIKVPHLLDTQEHPGGINHLVSNIEGSLRPGVTWSQIIEALTPAGSVSGAPKSSALQVIDRLEPSHRGPYCGAIGWIDADNQEADLAVGIRTFWIEQDETDAKRVLKFGTGAGITWQSKPELEWEETELKARHLINAASRSIDSHGEMNL